MFYYRLCKLWCPRGKQHLLAGESKLKQRTNDDEEEREAAKETHAHELEANEEKHLNYGVVTHFHRLVVGTFALSRVWPRRSAKKRERLILTVARQANKSYL